MVVIVCVGKVWRGGVGEVVGCVCLGFIKGIAGWGCSSHSLPGNGGCGRAGSGVDLEDGCGFVEKSGSRGIFGISRGNGSGS